MFSKRKEVTRWTYGDWAIIICERLSVYPNEPKQKAWILRSGKPIAKYNYKWSGRKFVVVIEYLDKEYLDKEYLDKEHLGKKRKKILAPILKTAHKAAKLLAKHFEINEDVHKAITCKLKCETEIYEAKQKKGQQPTLTPAVQ